MQEISVEIDVVADGEEFLARLVRNGALNWDGIDLILLDAHLPKRSAEEILTELGANGGIGVPCVVVSSIIMNSQRARYLKLGAMAVMTKPLDMDEYAVFARDIYSLFDSRED